MRSARKKNRKISTGGSLSSFEGHIPATSVLLCRQGGIGFAAAACQILSPFLNCVLDFTQNLG